MIHEIQGTPPILFGAGSSEKTGEKVKELGCKKVLCVFGKNVKKTGFADRIMDLIKEEGIDIVTYNEVVPDPPDDMIEKGAAFAKSEKVDGIIGIGGGSAMDTTKAINTLLGNPSPITRYLDKSIPLKPGIKMILIPTTAGTGSEVNAISVITDTANEKKGGVIGAPCVASVAIVDPKFTFGLPSEITAITGMDALAHGVEALTSAAANPVSDILAERTIELVYNNLPRAIEDPDDETARTNLSLAAMIAGIAFNSAPPQLGHAIAHTLGAFYHISHGTLCSVGTPEAVEFVADVMPDKIKTIGKAMDVDVESSSPAELGKVVADRIRKFARNIGLQPFSELSVNKDQFDRVAERVLEDDCAYFVPKKIDANQVREILDKAYERK